MGGVDGPGNSLKEEEGFNGPSNSVDSVEQVLNASPGASFQ